MSESTLQLVIQGGALGVLVLVLVGIFVLAVRVVPAMKDFFLKLTTELQTSREGQQVLTTEVRGGFTALGDRFETLEKIIGLDKRLSDIQHSVTATGQHQAVSVDLEQPDPPAQRRIPRAPSSPGLSR